MDDALVIRRWMKHGHGIGCWRFPVHEISQTKNLHITQVCPLFWALQPRTRWVDVTTAAVDSWPMGCELKGWLYMCVVPVFWN